MTKSVIRVTQLAGLGLCLALSAACEAQKSENPLSPNVAGPIAGVSITIPAPVSPANGAEVLNTSPVRLTFANSSSNGVRPLWYVVELAADSNFSSKLYTNGRVQPAEGAQTSITVDTSLPTEATYFWRVRADDGANASDFSAAAHFDLVVPVTIAPPVPTEPANGSTTANRTPTLRVNNGGVTGRAGTVEYRFEVATDQAFSNIVAAMSATRSGSATVVTTPQLAAGTLFYWRARGTNGEVTGPVSETWTFRTPAAPAPPPNPNPNPGPSPGPGGPPPAGSTISAELQDYVVARIEWLRVQYPQAWHLAHRHIDINGNPTGVSYEEAMRFAYIVAYDLYTHVSPRFGLNGKRGDPNHLSMDAFAYRMNSGANVRDVQIIDYIQDAGIDSARVAWGDVTAVSLPHGGGIWVQPHRPSEYRH